MIPVSVAALTMKRFVTPLIARFGYRNVLVTNTFLVGLAIASFAFVTPEQPVWLRVIQLFVLGAVNSLQFTAMNTVALKDLEAEAASSANSLLSVVQMLSMSLGVAAAAALMTTFGEVFPGEPQAHALRAFQATFVCVGAMTCASTWIFWQLSPEIRPSRAKEEPVEIA